MLDLGAARLLWTSTHHWMIRVVDWRGVRVQMLWRRSGSGAGLETPNHSNAIIFLTLQTRM